MSDGACWRKLAFPPAAFWLASECLRERVEVRRSDSASWRLHTRYTRHTIGCAGRMLPASPRAALALKRIDASTERRRGLFGREAETCSTGYLARELSCSFNSGYRRSTFFSIGKWLDCKDFHDRTKIKRFCFDRARFLFYLLVSDKSFGPSESRLPRRCNCVSTCKLNQSRRRGNRHSGSNQRVPVIRLRPKYGPLWVVLAFAARRTNEVELFGLLKEHQLESATWSSRSGTGSLL